MANERRIARDLLESYRRELISAPRERRANSFGARVSRDSPLLASSCVLLALLTIVVSLALNAIVGAFVPPLSWAAMRWWQRSKARRETILLERDLPSLLTSIASSVRAGIDPLKALGDAADQFPEESPLRRELTEFRAHLGRGGDEVELLGALCAGYEHPDIELFKRCLILSRVHGSSLAEPLHRVVRVVRQRQSFRRKTRAALAMHRMSAIGIAGCAALIGFMQLTVNRKGILIAIANPAGVLLLVGGASLVAAGVAWMLSMGREEKL